MNLASSHPKQQLRQQDAANIQNSDCSVRSGRSAAVWYQTKIIIIIIKYKAWYARALTFSCRPAAGPSMRESYPQSLRLVWQTHPRRGTPCRGRIRTACTTPPARPPANHHTHRRHHSQNTDQQKYRPDWVHKRNQKKNQKATAGGGALALMTTIGSLAKQLSLQSRPQRS